MRKVKFRAWDKRNAQMLYKISVADGGGHVWVPEDQIQIMTSTTHFEDSETGYWMLSSFELMQYTGLKDCNGKEIYESDILYFPEIDTYVEVFFDEGAFRVLDGDEPLVLTNKLLDANYDVSVTGNTFEHPELLEDA